MSHGKGKIALYEHHRPGLRLHEQGQFPTMGNHSPRFNVYSLNGMSPAKQHAVGP